MDGNGGGVFKPPNLPRNSLQRETLVKPSFSLGSANPVPTYSPYSHLTGHSEKPNGFFLNKLFGLQRAP
jgi:hypothetical protein